MRSDVSNDTFGAREQVKFERMAVFDAIDGLPLLPRFILLVEFRGHLFTLLHLLSF